MRRYHHVAAAESVFESLRIGNFPDELTGDGVSILLYPVQDATAALVPAAATREKEKKLWSAVFTALTPAVENP